MRSPFLDTAELKIALRERKVSWAFEKRAIMNYQKLYHWLMHAIRRPTRNFLGRFYFSLVCFILRAIRQLFRLRLLHMRGL